MFSKPAFVLYIPIGNALLVVTATDVDKSGASYYGEQGLYYLSSKGDGNIIPLSKLINFYDKFKIDILCREKRSHICCGMESKFRRVLCLLWLYLSRIGVHNYIVSQMKYAV